MIPARGIAGIGQDREDTRRDPGGDRPGRPGCSAPPGRTCVWPATGTASALNDRGRASVRWLHARAPLQENALIRLPQTDVAAIFASASGQQRVNELFRRAQRMRVSRTVVATVAMQDDYMKRVRGGGGARDQLRAEGIVIFGDYAGDQVLASALGLPRPGPGEFVSARLVPRPGADGDGAGGDGAAERATGRHGDYARSIRLAGADWLLASAADPPSPAPVLPR